MKDILPSEIPRNVSPPTRRIFYMCTKITQAQILTAISCLQRKEHEKEPSHKTGNMIRKQRTHEELLSDQTLLRWQLRDTRPIYETRLTRLDSNLRAVMDEKAAGKKVTSYLDKFVANDYDIWRFLKKFQDRKIPKEVLNEYKAIRGILGSQVAAEAKDDPLMFLLVELIARNFALDQYYRIKLYSEPENVYLYDKFKKFSDSMKSHIELLKSFMLAERTDRYLESSAVKRIAEKRKSWRDMRHGRPRSN